MDSEAIYQALFMRLRQAQGFVTYSRRLRHWNNTAEAEQPSLMTSEGRRLLRQTKGVPAIHELFLNVFLYAIENDTERSPAEKLNPLIDAVVNVIGVDSFSDHAQTLGGLVSHCWVESVETDEGTLGNQAVAMITINIRLAG
jgi:hypothetical protein